MSWFKTFLPEPEPEFSPVVPNLDKIERNIERYRRAIEQNKKGDARKNELKRGLTYWEKVKELAVMEANN